ncbi:hypothetical protein WISP_56108 [Willisornis vidua]|uniref:Uncharacterized protein n=1 Tax=Willisornis vidua TaxID=1566151 RepID=A0ABQ9DHN9_9PASS|nr:hypothetical protein WISP_56108 [Willisornis vidua]
MSCKNSVRTHIPNFSLKVLTCAENNLNRLHGEFHCSVTASHGFNYSADKYSAALVLPCDKLFSPYTLTTNCLKEPMQPMIAKTETYSCVLMVLKALQLSGSRAEQPSHSKPVFTPHSLSHQAVTIKEPQSEEMEAVLWKFKTNGKPVKSILSSGNESETVDLAKGVTAAMAAQSRQDVNNSTDDAVVLDLAMALSVKSMVPGELSPKLLLWDLLCYCN